jgi:hypothetical protein
MPLVGILPRGQSLVELASEYGFFGWQGPVLVRVQAL